MPMDLGEVESYATDTREIVVHLCADVSAVERRVAEFMDREQTTRETCGEILTALRAMSDVVKTHTQAVEVIAETFDKQNKSIENLAAIVAAVEKKQESL